MDQDRRRLLLLAAMSTVQGITDILMESDDDEIFEIIQTVLNPRCEPRRRVPRIENYVENIIAGLTREEFKAHFRMSPETCYYVLTRIEQRLKRTSSGTPMISPRTQFLLTLWRLGTPDSFRSICERFNVGRSTALYITRRVVRVIIQLAPVIIKWPTGDQLNEVMEGFEKMSTFPKVLGAIDGTHINILAPKQHPESYVNRKGHHSIQLQAICDDKCRFIHCFVGHVGSVHDQRVFRQSEVQSYLGDITKFPQNSHLLGDLAYKLHENLLTPYSNNGHLTERQQNYNYCHSSARMAIERAFGLLKGRFRSLLTVFAMHRVDLIPAHILACCVLHNLCLMNGDDLNFEINEAIIDEVDNGHNVVNNVAHAAIAKRDYISETLRIRRV